MVKMSIKPSTKTLKFMAPCSGVQILRRGQVGFIVNMHLILENCLLCSQINLRITECMVIMFIKPSTELKNFMNLWSGVKALGRGKMAI